MEVIIEGVTKVYSGGIRALDGVDLRFGRGTFGLLGPNGAGKTTLLRILVTLIRPSGGEVTIGGNCLRSAGGAAAIKRLIGYLPQELGLYPDLTAVEMVDYLAILKGLSDRAARRRRVVEVLDLVNLTDDRTRKIKTFSGGMKRRVGLAQALVNNPGLLIVDEPTAGLDPEERIRLRTLLVELGRDRTVVLSTHIVEDVAQTCQALAVQARGRVVYSGTTRDLGRQAAGAVWTIERRAEDPPPAEGVVVGMIPTEHGVRYRVIGEHAPGGDALAQAAEPTLEDGYVWLLRRHAPEPMDPGRGSTFFK